MVPAADAVGPAVRQHNRVLALRIPFAITDAKQTGFNKLHVHRRIHGDSGVLSQQWPAQTGHELKIFKHGAVLGFVPLRWSGNID